MGVFDSSGKEEHEMRYMNDVDEALHRRGHPLAFTLSLAVLVFFGVAVIWADSAMIDGVTRGTGQVIPAHGIHFVQNERGGTIIALQVEENQLVEKNQTLLNISNVEAVAGLIDFKNRATELRLTLKRLQAEELDIQLSFTELEEADFPHSAQAQLRLFKTRRKQYEGQAEVIESQIEARRKDVAGAKERKEACEDALALLRKEEETVRGMVGRSYSQIQYLELRSRIVGQEGELNSVAQTIARAESGVMAAEERLANMKAERMAGIADEFNKTRLELSTIENRILASDEQVTRTEMRSPVKGTVKRILLKKDSVAKPAETIMEILPTEGALEIEAKFSPQDRGFLFVNQPATVKVTAYDFSIYGGLSATVTKISNDTIEDKKGEPWYNVRLMTKRKSILYRGEELDILTGMTVNVDVLTDKESVLSHILSPVRRAIHSAMTEH